MRTGASGIGRWGRRGAAVAVVAACSTSGGATVGDGGAPDAPVDDGDAARAGDGGDGGVRAKALAFTERLGDPHAGHFLVGMGNDGTGDGNDPAYALGAPIDLHYHYLTNVHSASGWTTWNTSPDYAGKRIREAKAHGVVTVLTLYMMASKGDGNIAGELGDASFMADWFADYAQLLATVRAEDVPAVLHVEPDFWGYAEIASDAAGGPENVAVRVAAGQASNGAACAGLGDTLVGFGRCVVAMARAAAPKLLVGFHASSWGTGTDVFGNVDPALDVAAKAAQSAAFFRAIGAADADFVATDLLDRDAGCYEAGHAPMCAPARTDVYWDEANQRLPHFHQSLAFVGALTTALGLPLLWWQLPFGSPSAAPGGAVGAWRDDRVHYFFAHPGELVSAGGVGAVWGAGAADQTSVTDEFKAAVATYMANPTSLR